MPDAEDARYEDFITSTKKRDQSKKPKVNEKVQDIDISDEEEIEDSYTGDEEDDGLRSDDEMNIENFSTHEKKLLGQRAKIEQVERENLEAKSWTMQGETGEESTSQVIKEVQVQCLLFAAHKRLCGSLQWVDFIFAASVEGCREVLRYAEKQWINWSFRRRGKEEARATGKKRN